MSHTSRLIEWIKCHSLQTAVLVIAASSFLLTWYHKEYVQLRIFKIYIMEWTFLTSLLLLCIHYQNRYSESPIIFLKNLLIKLKPLTLFFIIGILRLAIDLPLMGRPENAEVLPFAPQYSLIWVYPLFWTGLAYSIHILFSQAGRIWVGAILIAQTLPNFWDQRFHSVALGPIFLVVVWIYLARGIEIQGYFNQRKNSLKALFLIALAALPLWRMWFWNRTSRAAFIIAIVLMTFIPLAYTAYNKTFKTRHSLMATLYIFCLLMGGLLYFRPLELVIPETIESVQEMAQIVFKKKTSRAKAILNGEKSDSLTEEENPSESFSEKFYTSMRHAEDKSDSLGQSEFAGRTRRLMWRVTIEQWKEKILFGVGFFKFVPLLRGPGVLNIPDWAKNDQYRPINGAHNSYITIAARMGLVGVCVFAWIFGYLAREIAFSLREPIDFRPGKMPSFESLFIPLLIAGILGGAVYAFFNVGLENPQNGLLVWLFSGILIAENVHLKKNQREKTL